MGSRLGRVSHYDISNRLSLERVGRCEFQSQIRRGQPGGWSISFARPKETDERKRRPGEPPASRVALRYSTSQAAAELALVKRRSEASAQTVLADFP